MSKYCPDCGDPLTNPKRCNCGWVFKESAKSYPETCMSIGCDKKTDVVFWSNGSPITRCAWHYTQDLRGTKKNQLRDLDEKYYEQKSSEYRGQLSSILKKIMDKKRVAA
jgi:hypothetical protein